MNKQWKKQAATLMVAAIAVSGGAAFKDPDWRRPGTETGRNFGCNGLWCSG